MSAITVERVPDWVCDNCGAYRLRRREPRRAYRCADCGPRLILDLDGCERFVAGTDIEASGRTHDVPEDNVVRAWLDGRPN